jgi:two-component system sensor histidine kinase SenX3
MPGVRLRRRPPLILVTIGVLLVLLPLLAYLQYEWQGQVSQAMRAQMLEQMQRAARQFNDDFGRTLSELNKSFQPALGDEETPAERLSQLRRQYEELYARWSRTALHPQLVRNLYLIAPFDGPAKAVEHLNPSTGRFEPEPRPDAFPALRQGADLAVMRFAATQGKVVQISAPIIDWKTPAILFPIVDVPNLPTETLPKNLEIPVPSPVAEAIVELNLDYIRHEFIPALANLHLSNADGTQAYNFAVIDRTEPQRIVYANTSLIDVPPKGDVTAAIYEPGVLDQLPAMESTPSGQQRGVVAVRIQQQGTAKHPETAASWMDPPWELVLTHRAGSLEAAVARSRARNLAIGFGILLLLAISVGLTLVSVQRERRLAQQQMDFVSAVSHELRTPLAVICSAGENLADGVVEDQQATRQYGALVRNEGRRLTELVEQVLDFAGIQSGKSRYRFEPTDLGELIDRALEMFEMQIQESTFTVEKRVSPNLPMVMADRPAFVQVLQNLIGNALKHGKSGKFLSVRAESANRNVTLTVEDHGAGISSIDLPHVFEPFYRGRAARDAQIKGSGLGLSLVKQILELHGASIRADSPASGGTTFTISIPGIEPLSDVIGSNNQAYSPR